MFNRNYLGAGGILLVLAGWQIVAMLLKQPLLLPTPAATGAQMVGLAGTFDFWHHLGASLLRGLSGFGVAFGAGALVGFGAGRLDWLSGLLRPATVFIRSTPSMTLIILALIWFKGDGVALFVIFLVVFPLVVENIEIGIRRSDRELLEMLQVYQVSERRRLTVFYLPQVLPFLTAAAANGLGMTWKVLIAAEVLSSPLWGVGTRLDAARIYLLTDQVFAWTVWVVLIGFCFDYLINQWLRKPFLTWKAERHD